MSKNELDDKEFQPRIGFEKSDEESSFSFSEFNQKSLKSEEFLEEFEKGSENLNKNLSSLEEMNDSKGLNQGFCMEKSESVSLGEPVKFLDELDENTEIKIMKCDAEQEPKKIQDLMLSPSNTIPKAEENNPGMQVNHSTPYQKKTCCKRCLVF